MALEAVIFDMGGVFVPTTRLSDLYHSLELYVRNLKHVRKSPFAYLKAVHSLMKPLMKGMSFDEWKDEFAYETGIPGDDLDDYLGRSCRGIRHLDPSMLLLVEELKAAGVRVGLLSDTIRQHAKIFEEKGFYEPFRPNVLLSCDYSAIKPDPYFFDSMLIRFEMQGVECIKRDPKCTSRVDSARDVAFVDDNPEFVDSFILRYGGLGIHHKDGQDTRDCLLYHLKSR